MDTLVYLLGPIGCVLGAVACTTMMARRRPRRDASPAPVQDDEGPALRTQIAEPAVERSAAHDG